MRSITVCNRVMTKKQSLDISRCKYLGRKQYKILRRLFFFVIKFNIVILFFLKEENYIRNTVIFVPVLFCCVTLCHTLK